MSTYITVTSDTSRLVNRVKQVQQTNREAQLQRERDTTLQAKVQAELADTSSDTDVSRGGNPDTSVDRRPAAHRVGKIGVFPVWITYSRFEYTDRSDSWVGFEEGLEIWPIYNTSAHLRLTGPEPLISWPAGNSNDEGIYRNLLFIFPINGESAIVTYLVDWNINFCPVGYNNFDETVTTYRARHIKCAVVGLTSAREIAAPTKLRERLDYLHPQLPDASFPTRIKVYQPSQIAAWYPDEYIGDKYPIQRWHPETNNYPGYSYPYGYDSSRPYSMQNMLAYGIGNLSPLESEYGSMGFGVSYNVWTGVHTNSLFSAGIYDVLLRYDKSIQDGDTFPGPFIYDEGHWDEEYDIPVIEKYLSLNQFKGGWVSIDNNPETQYINGNYAFVDPLIRNRYKTSKTAKIETVRMVPDIKDWKEVSPKNMKDQFQQPYEYTDVDGFYTQIGVPSPTDCPNYAYNWGNEAYCKSQLRQLGFKDEDMKP